MPRSQYVDPSRMTPYVKKFVPKTSAKPRAPITRGYKTSRNQLKGEVFCKDVSINQNHVPVGVLTLLNGISQGDDISNRKGRKINIKSIHIKGAIYTLATSVAEQCVARMALVWDKQANGVDPTFAQVYVDSTSHAGATRNLDNRERFVILAEHSWSSSAGGLQCYPVDFFKKVNLDTVFKGTNDEIASIATGSLYLFTWGAEIADTANHGMNSAVKVRVRYQDA